MIDLPDLDALAAAAGLPVARRSQQAAAWSAVLGRCGHAALSHTAATQDYLLAYHQGADRCALDCSLLLLAQGKPVAVWPMRTLCRLQGDRWRPVGLQIDAPLFQAESASLARKLVARCLDLAQTLSQELGLDGFESTDPFQPQRALSEWVLQSMQRGATCQYRHEMMLDTARPLDHIVAGFNQTTRYDIKRGRQCWATQALTAASPDPAATWSAFRALHQQVSGRQTRGDTTWDLLLAQIQRDEAFLIHLSDAEGRMVGGGFFRMTASEAEYAVAAYDRSLFDKPLGHVVQHEAIRLIGARGIGWYRIGAWPMPGDSPPASEKELAIARFKKNFSSAVVLRQQLTHPRG